MFSHTAYIEGLEEDRDMWLFVEELPWLESWAEGHAGLDDYETLSAMKGLPTEAELLEMEAGLDDETFKAGLSMAAL